MPRESSCLTAAFSKMLPRQKKELKRKQLLNAKKTTKREEAPAIQNQAASTTLGDIDALAALKEQLENKKK